MSILLKSNTLGHEPYQRLSRLIQYKFDKKFWNDDNPEKKLKIFEGYKSLFGVQEGQMFDVKELASNINSILDIIITTPETAKIPASTIPQSRAETSMDSAKEKS